MAYLILVRHGITDWNAEGKWHGLTDIPLNEVGKNQAKSAAKLLKHLKIDVGYTSALSRTQQTYQEICDELSLSCPMISHLALNERDYGIYTGKNKWKMQKKLGEEQFFQLRRGWDYPVPGGESLKDVYNRVVPFYQEKIAGELKQGKNVLVVSSGNALRSLIKYVENVSDEEIVNRELNYGEVYIIEL